MSDYPGKFIVLEGIDGTGKTTVATELVELLSPVTKVVLTREPFHKKWKEIKEQCGFKSPEAIASLMQSFRYEHAESVIIPALEAGHIVICDRYTWSTLAYQASGDIPRNRKITIEAMVSNSYLSIPVPDRTFLLDTPNYKFLRDRVLRRDPEDTFPDFKTFTQMRERYLLLAKTVSNQTTVSITEKNGAKRSLTDIISDMIPTLKEIGVNVPQ